ncbi:MAG: tetratricopeptide domain protein [Chitinophagaceae bacterium]|nr:tetratricopeptide domain protein [Chitinophagaceae bacterium]
MSYFVIMKKYLLFFFAVTGLSLSSFAQTEDSKTLQATARSFMQQGDFNNAVIVLTRALQKDKNNIELQKDLINSYYYKRDYDKALEGVKALIDRNDADVMTYQMAGNVYKALEQVKDCEKMYRTGLKKFPKSGPLYSEYGELLWSKKDYSAIDLWEKGIQEDPAYSGNYYNAALYYYYTKDKVWSLLYGEIFVNMESLTERAAAMKQLLLDGYKLKLFTDPDLLKDLDKNKSGFSKAFLQSMNKEVALGNRGVTTESLTMIRTRFILEWFDKYAEKFPFRLFDYQRQLIQEGMFDAYNQWLFGPVENLARYDNWNKTHNEEYASFTAFQKTRVFKMPPGQYYQAK